MTKLKFLPLLLLFSACVENSPEPINKSVLISGNDAFGKTYSISSIELELGTLQPHPCLTDNFITYFPNGNYEINEGATKCDPNDPPALVGFWEMNRDQTQLLVDIDGFTQTWNVESVNRQNHRISSLFNEGERIYSLTATN
ncbi:MAG: hypothetical protein ABJG78_03680 [Cyclobacteriaceae bacterium]